MILIFIRRDFPVYTCIIYFNNINKAELLRLLNLLPDRNKDFKDDCIYLNTRKLWKFFWFNNLFKKFQREFYYSHNYNPFRPIKVPSRIHDKYNYKIILTETYSYLLNIYFIDIKDIWKIKLFMFLK